MIKVYIPDKKTKVNKAKIRGLWFSNNQGLCYDYLNKINTSFGKLARLKKEYNQEALFYTTTGQGFKNKAYIYYNDNKQDELKFIHYFSYDKQKRGFKAYLKELLRLYGGLTIYIREFNYLIEAWN